MKGLLGQPEECMKAQLFLGSASQGKVCSMNYLYRLKTFFLMAILRRLVNYEYSVQEKRNNI